MVNGYSADEQTAITQQVGFITVSIRLTRNRCTELPFHLKRAPKPE